MFLMLVSLLAAHGQLAGIWDQGNIAADVLNIWRTKTENWAALTKCDKPGVIASRGLQLWPGPHHHWLRGADEGEAGQPPQQGGGHQEDSGGEQHRPWQTSSWAQGRLVKPLDFQEMVLCFIFIDVCICGIFYFVTQVPLMDLQYNFSLPKVLTWWFQSNRSVSITSVSPTSQHSSGLSFKERSKSVSERGMRDVINVIRKTIKLSVSSRLSFQLSSWEKKKQEMQHFWHNQWKCSD